MSERKFPVLEENRGRIDIFSECRKYTVENSPLFSSVTARGRELLSRPMEIVLSANGGKQTIDQIENLPLKGGDGSVTVLSTMQTELFFLNTEIRVEEDGCCFVRLSLMARGYTVPQIFGIVPKAYSERRVDSLYVDIPLCREHSRLYQTDPRCTVFGNFEEALPADLRCAGAVPAGGLHAAFIPQLYLCSEEAGCGVFFESNEGWVAADENRVIEVIENDGERVLRIRLLDGEPDTWRAYSGDLERNVDLMPVSFNFGFMATPVRELPKNMFPDRSFHIDCFKKIEGYYEDFFAGPVVEGSDETGFDRIQRLGVKVLYLHEKWNDIQNSSVLTERTRRRLRYVTEECHRRGIKVIPYFGYEISTLSPYFDRYGTSAVNSAPGDGLGWMWNRWPSQRALGVCYGHEEFRERFVREVTQIIEEFDLDGIYLDSTLCARACRNHLHGCSWKDRNGTVHETYPFSAVRAVLKPIYEFVRKRGGIMNLHGYGSMSLPGIAYATSLWEGENFQSLLMKGVLTEMPEALLRCQFTSRNIGVPVMSLCYSDPPRWTYRNAISMSLLHGSMPKPVDIGEPLELTSKVWDAFDAFPVAESEFLPYYEQKLISVAESGVKVSLYRAEGCALVIVAGVNSSVDAEVRLDLSGIGAVRIEDALTGEVREGSSCTCAVRGFDFVLLKVACGE